MGVITKRQKELLQALADGADCREAASRLGVSYETARKHAKNAIDRLGQHTQAGAVATAIRNGLIK